MDFSRIDAWRTVFSHVEVVMTRSPDEQHAYLAQLEQSDPFLHAQVLALLKSEESARNSGFLEPTRGGSLEPPLQPDARLGPYRIERALGVGGTGTVWLAHRDDGLYEGQVAIKVIHRHLTSSAVRERFRREASLLGRLQHPNIARILDAGMHDGAAYLVLEHIQGQSIDTWCDERRLSVPRRLQLFLEVCEAVAHAHANLIVHRDIKPSNILVTDDGRVKLLDFGLGKLLGDDVADGGAALTQVTGRVLTPEFAAPEQILNEPITIATDVYSLGLLLYILLSGIRPFAAAGPAVARIEQAVLSLEPLALDRAARQAGETSATCRSTNVSRLQAALKGDLSNIVALAMHKRAQERYRSILALADDVRRHLAHQPVGARKASPTYRLGRFIQRHRLGTAATTLAVIAIAVAVGSAMLQARVARLEAGRATAVKQFMLDVFNANSIDHPEGARARQTTAEELLDIAGAQLLKSGTEDPALRAELLGVLGNLNAMLEKSGQAEALYRQRIEALETNFPANDRRLATAYIDLAEVLVALQRYDEVPDMIRKAVNVLDVNRERASRDRGRSEHILGYVDYLAGRNDLALNHFAAEVAILEELPPSNDLVMALYGLGKAHLSAGNADEALRCYERGIALATEMLGPASDSAATGHQGMANALTYLRRLPEAQRHLDLAIDAVARIFGPESGSMAVVLLERARLQMQQGLYRDAVITCESIVAMRERLHGDEDRSALGARTILGLALFESGDFPRADAVLNSTLASLRDAGDPRTLIMNHRTRALLRLEQDRPREALDDARIALDLIATLNVAAASTTAQLHAIRAEALTVGGAAREAHVELQAAAAALEPERSARIYPVSVTVRLAQAGVDLAERNSAQAEDSAAAVVEELRGRDDRGTLWTLEDAALRLLARTQHERGKLRESCASLDAAIALRETNALPGDPRLASSRRLRAQCPAPPGTPFSRDGES